MSYTYMIKVVALLVAFIHIQEWIVIRPLEKVYFLAFLIVLLSILDERNHNRSKVNKIERIIFSLVGLIAFFSSLFSNQIENSVLCISFSISIIIPVFCVKKVDSK